MYRYALLVAYLVASGAASADIAAFVNVNVIPMDHERVIEQQTVIVSDGIIGTIGHVDEVPVPEGARVIDGTDRFLIPGLAEMLAHVPPAGSERDRDHLRPAFQPRSPRGDGHGSDAAVS